MQLDADTPRGTGRDRRVNRVAALPDAGSIHLWQTLARRYREEPAVLYDVFSEPHTPLGDDLSTLVVPGPGGELVHLGDRRVTMEVWQAWASRLLETIRAEDPRTLVFLSGIDWGYDLRGMPVRPGGEPLPGVVYSTHVYPWSGPTGLMHAARGWTDRTRLRRAWDAAFGCLAAGVPVFVAEWGGGPGDRRWGTRLLHYMQQRRLGWTAGSWRDRPRLVEPPGDETAEPAPTPFGALVRQALAERCP